MRALVYLAAITAVVATIAVPSAAVADTGAPAVTRPCPKLEPDARCGHVDVPLDRSAPDGATIPIGFVILPRTSDAKPALTPIFMILGGPGEAASANISAADYDFAGARSRHDVVLVDYRGEGRSDPIDCAPLQHLVTNSMGDLIRAVGTCGKHLGDASDRYGAADVADDIDAVRAALGYATIDLDGLSYGTVQAQAYALRHREHLRALILDGAISPLDRAGSWVLGTSNATAVADDVAIVCRRSPSCSRANPHPAGTFAALARRLRHHAVAGTDSTSAAGRKLHVDEATLIRIATASDFTYSNDGELVAAAAALLRRNDPAPLLRLAAEVQGPLVGDGGDPAAFSAGVNAATQCIDFPVPWSRSASFARRRVQFEKNIRRLKFGPFSPDAWASNGGFSGFCLQWPARDNVTPVFTRHAHFPAVPVLVVAATLDTSTTLAQGRFVAREFPHAQVVVLRNGGHVPGFYAPCIPRIYARFLRTLKAGDTGCVRTGDPDRPAVATFPRHVGDAPAATAIRGDRSRAPERRLATVIWGTVQDALRQSFRFPDPRRGTGTGLRGGTFHETFNFRRGVQRLSLHALRFSEDVAVDGHVKVDNGNLSATLTVTAPKHHGGAIRLHGRWFTDDSAAGRIELHGHLSGRRIALSTTAG